MSLSIALLDCSRELKIKIEKQGFDVSEGTIGFCTGSRKFPSAIYEKDVFIYNPTKLKKDGNSYIRARDIKELTPEFNLGEIDKHIQRGALLLTFINNLSDDKDDDEVQSRAYKWIPHIPDINKTKDFQPLIMNLDAPDYLSYKYISPLLNTDEIKKPHTQ